MGPALLWHLAGERPCLTDGESQCRHLVCMSFILEEHTVLMAFLCFEEFDSTGFQSNICLSSSLARFRPWCSGPCPLRRRVSSLRPAGRSLPLLPFANAPQPSPVVDGGWQGLRTHHSPSVTSWFCCPGEPVWV